MSSPTKASFGSIYPIEEYRESARAILQSSLLKKSRLQKLFEDIAKRLSENYAFKVFAPNSINFGLLVTYRQKWVPQNYQVGDLVSSITLAPGEVRKYTTKTVIKKSRSEKEVEDSLQIRKQDSSDTSRTDTEIVRKAQNKTSFKKSAEGGLSLPKISASASISKERESSRESASTKKIFHENVVKSSQEYKQNHKTEVETKSSEEIEETTSGEIKNPNDEIPVTYLFYDLQRRYEISEKLYKVTPVVLIANQVPKPNEIDEDWLLTYEWILRRVILDDSFLVALDYLHEDLVGNELSIEVLRTNLEKQSKIIDKITKQVAVKSRLVLDAFNEIDSAEEPEGRTISTFWGLFEKEIPPSAEEIENFLKLREHELNLFRSLKQEADQLRAQLSQEVATLTDSTQKYSEALKEHFNQRTEIDRLRIHIKENILYYMQAIWDNEHDDQLFFRLYDLEVLNFNPSSNVVPSSDITKIDDENAESNNMSSILDKCARTERERGSYYDVSLPLWSYETKNKTKLVEIADLNNPLGFKGNYMIFPLKTEHYITDYMMQDYVDQTLGGIRDPDEYGNYSVDEIVELICHIYKKDPDSFTDDLKKEFQDIIAKRLTSARREKEDVIIPTDSLYLEAMPGTRPVLENFKLAHRAIDVKKVESEVRKQELDNIRRAAKILKGELEDPDIEKQVMITGDKEVQTVTDVTDNG